MRSTWSTLCLFTAVAATAPGAARAGEGAPTGSERYSVMTYNIGGKPGYTGYALDNGASCDERARQIAQHILDMPDQPDILVFAEATGDCYKDGLTKLLHDQNGPYQSFIHQMSDGTARFQDSGLMFFSKFPWTVPGAVDGCPEPVLVDPLTVAGQPVFGEAKGDFMGFSDLAFSDRYMAKGVGYACVTNPSTGQPINVFFTHNQANYWTPGGDLDDFAHEERIVNMKEASDFVELMAPAWYTEKTGQAVIFAGDMNIMGNDVAYWIDQGDGAWHDGQQEIERVIRPDDANGWAEYAEVIGPAGLLHDRNGLRDPWRADGTRDPLLTEFDHWGDPHGDMGYVYDPSAVNDVDMGFTWDALRNGQTDGDQFRERLDYILDRQVAWNGHHDCYQHMTVERGFAYAPSGDVQKEYWGMDLSDHYPLRAEIGPLEPQCSPAIAASDVVTPTTVTVHHAGGRKWFYYTQPGTYTFDATTAAALELHAYAASDLSTDLVPREGDGTIDAHTGERRFDDPVVFKADGPFYVMVSFQDPLHVGSFTFKPRKNNCASWDTAVWLDPYQAAHVDLAALPTIQSRCYFKIEQDEDLDGAAVEVRAVAVALNTDWTPATARFELFAHDAPSQTNPVPLETGGWGTWSTEFSTKLGADPAYRYLVVDRSGPPAPTQGAMLDVVWTRNLTVVDIKKFTVVNQDDPDGGDEVKIFWHLGDASDDPWPSAPDDATANGAWPTQMTYYYDGLASGASSKHPQIECATWCPLAPSLADSHHIVLAYPQALWGFAWEIDDTSPDDPLFHEGLFSEDGRFRITALDPDPWQWIGEGDVNTSVPYQKDLWADFFGYSHGYRLVAERHGMQ